MSLIKNKRWVHFIGIGGIGMSGLAELLLKLGSRVSGSDSSDSETVRRLKSLGAQVITEHSKDNYSKVDAEKLPDCVVFSTAINAANPEIAYAEARDIPIIRRAEMLAEIMRLKRGLAVAGSHGKTTTTGMISLLLQKCGFDPTVVIGGKFDAIGSNAAWGGGDWMVAEADESDGSFLRLSPELAVVTNIDREHLDHYRDLEHAKEIFLEFLDRLPFYGRAILCSDCEHLRDVGKRLKKSKIWYGFDEKQKPDYLIRILKESFPAEFSISSKSSSYKDELIKTSMAIPGRHNISNATGAILAARELGADLQKVSQAMREFKGVQRRFEHKGFYADLHPVIEDYAHHPTEIRATLEAARSYFGKNVPLTVVFQPHRYSRTKELWDEFKNCFEGVETLLTLPTYAASEPKTESTEKFDKINFSNHVKGLYVDSISSAASKIKEIYASYHSNVIRPLLILGAGDVPKVISLLNPSPEKK